MSLTKPGPSTHFTPKRGTQRRQVRRSYVLDRQEIIDRYGGKQPLGRVLDGDIDKLIEVVPR